MWLRTDGWRPASCHPLSEPLGGAAGQQGPPHCAVGCPGHTATGDAPGWSRQGGHKRDGLAGGGAATLADHPSPQPTKPLHTPTHTQPTTPFTPPLTPTAPYSQLSSCRTHPSPPPPLPKMVAFRTLLSSVAAAAALMVGVAATTLASTVAAAVPVGAHADGAARLGSLFKPPVGPGKNCGGITGAVCFTGLTCEHGTCRGGQREGEKCSSTSFAGTRVCSGGKCNTTTTVCEAELVCKAKKCRHA